MLRLTPSPMPHPLASVAPAPPRRLRSRAPRLAGLRGLVAIGAASCALLCAGGAFAQPAQAQAPGAQPPPPPTAQGLPAQPPAQPPPMQPGAPAQPGAPQPGIPAQPGAPQPGYPAQPYQQPPPYPQGYPPGYYGPYYPPPGYYYQPQQQTTPPPPPVPMRRNSSGMMYGGIALTGLGAVGLVVGTAMAASANNRYEIYCDNGGYPYPCDQRDDDTLLTASWVVMGASLLSIGVGITLWVVGGKKVPVKAKEEAPKAAFSLGVGNASMTVSF